MKRTALLIFSILLVIAIASVSTNAAPMVFSVTHAIRDIGVDFATKAIQQQTTTGIQTVPEPSTLVLLGSAITGLFGLRARQRNRR